MKLIFREITEMSGDVNNRKAEVEKLNRLGRLVDRYAQSRSLELLIGMGLFVMNVILILMWYYQMNLIRQLDH